MAGRRGRRRGGGPISPILNRAKEAPASRAAVFRALASGVSPEEVSQHFGLTPDQLQTIFQEAADYYRSLEESVWSLYTDGASRGNPGLAGAGAVLVAPDGEVSEFQEFLGQATNNVAEYQALLLGLKMALKLGIRNLRVYSDSELLVRQLQGTYRVKQPHLLVLWQQVRQELQKFESSKVTHVPREMNREADRLANQAIDQRPPSR